MDHVSLTSAHRLTRARARMNAKQEQAYYEQAAARQALLEGLFNAVSDMRQSTSAHFASLVAAGKSFGHGLTARKALH